MAKPVIKFDTVAYDIGGHTGYRPQLEAQDGKYDLDFCREVVTVLAGGVPLMPTQDALDSASGKCVAHLPTKL